MRNAQTGKWRLTDPWQTGFVDLHGHQGLLGQVTGRTSATVVAWRYARSQAWRDAVEVIAIDRSPTTLHTAWQTCPPRRRIAPTHWLALWLPGSPRASLTSP